jgi:D-glycero-alpha-D-manno-heptose-7-phosphate kinase
VGDVSVPVRVVDATAPIRVCDNGGWTDTWFARHGKVFNIAVEPCVEVQICVHPIGGLPDRIHIDAQNYGDRYSFDLRMPPGRHPLLEAAIQEIGIPDGVSIDIRIRSEVPAGCSTGTSASATVALIGALDALTPGRMTPHEIAYAAHRIESERLGMESGIQDQLCAAYGGINFIEMSSYPVASVVPITVPDPVWSELDRRLVLVFLGRAHVSSDVHDRVIASLEPEGGDAPALDALRDAAQAARDAVVAADFLALGRAMVSNTDAQRRLHGALVSADAQTVIDVARANGALGWKVNGAGGEGGSVSLLCGLGMRSKEQLLRAIGDASPLFQVIPTSISRHGVRVWEPRSRTLRRLR